MGWHGGALGEGRLMSWARDDALGRGAGVCQSTPLPSVCPQRAETACGSLLDLSA